MIKLYWKILFSFFTLLSLYFKAVSLIFRKKHDFKEFRNEYTNEKKGKYQIAGVYIIFYNNEILYVGESDNILDRLGNTHYSGGKGAGSDLIDKLYEFGILKEENRNKRRDGLKNIGLKVKYLELEKNDKERQQRHRIRKFYESFFITILNPKCNK